MWKRTMPSQCSFVLRTIADFIGGSAEKIVAIEADNCGKIVVVTLSEEIPTMLDQIRFFAGAARLRESRAATGYKEGMTRYVRREPVGVCGAVTPRTYHMMVAPRKCAPALTAFNTMVLEPGDSTKASTTDSLPWCGSATTAGRFASFGTLTSSECGSSRMIRWSPRCRTGLQKSGHGKELSVYGSRITRGSSVSWTTLSRNDA